MASEVIILNLIPTGTMPVFHASQFDTGRLITCELYRGDDAYSVPEGYTVELHCRKVDNNIVTMESTLINDNVVTFTSTEQLTACNGKNLCEVAILDEGYRIGTLNFWLEVEIDPLKGGINSTSEIHDLYEQVEDITEEVIGNNYYNKTEVDDLLDAKADKSTTYTKTQVDTLLTSKADTSSVYTKSETNTLLAAKADAATTYTKTEIDTALALKANAADVYTKSQVDTALAAKADADTTTAALATKADKSDTYTKAQVDTLIDNIFPTLTASGAIATFTTALTKPLVSVTAAEGATEVTACGINLWNEQWEVGNIDNTGADSPATDRIRSKGYIKVEGFASLYIVTPTPMVVHKYASDKSYLGNNYISASGVYNVATNVAYIRFRTDTSYGTEYNDDISINCLSTDTTYHAYNGQTVPVADATTLTTQSGLNNVYSDAGNITVQYKYMSM